MGKACEGVNVSSADNQKCTYVRFLLNYEEKFFLPTVQTFKLHIIVQACRLRITLIMVALSLWTFVRTLLKEFTHTFSYYCYHFTCSYRIGELGTLVAPVSLRCHTTSLKCQCHIFIYLTIPSETRLQDYVLTPFLNIMITCQNKRFMNCINSLTVLRLHSYILMWGTDFKKCNSLLVVISHSLLDTYISWVLAASIFMVECVLGKGHAKATHNRSIFLWNANNTYLPLYHCTRICVMSQFLWL